MLYLTRADIKFLHRKLEELERRVGDETSDPHGNATGPDPAEPDSLIVAKSRRTASVVSSAHEVRADATPPSPLHAGPPERRPSLFADLSFESLIGGKLPIWIGGIALVFAGFFLVRFTIEAGLFGPGARSIAAVIFAFAMIAISELGGRLPKIGASFTADPRVGQSLAGAGVATLYGTLYMASEIYGLIILPTSFILVVITTAIAFGLSLRHGAPTALMGLAGGFAAPWVAGMGASNLPTLLLYLTVFIAALFGLAIWRRWLWLLVLASGGGALWSIAMLATAEAHLGLLGGFIALSGAGALIAATRFAETSIRWNQAARYLPMALAFMQLAILLPKMDFSTLGWTFYFALSLLSIALAWRDKSLLPVVAGALLLSASPLAGAWNEHGASSTNIAMTLGIGLLFGATGHVRARSREEAATLWALVGLAAPLLCWFSARTTDNSALNDDAWAGSAILVAIPSAVMAWEWHKRQRIDVVQGYATAATALMLWMAFANLFESDQAASYSALVALAVAGWAHVTGGRTERQIAVVPLAIAIMAGIVFSNDFLRALAASLAGEKAIYDFLPSFADATRMTFVPALLILAITWQKGFATSRMTRTTAFVIGGSGVTAMIWLIVKQPAAIAGHGAFIQLGFVERMVITQALFGLGSLALRQAKLRHDWPSLLIAGWVLAAVAFFRFVWFDLLLLDPVIVPQAVGPVPVANLLTAHLVLVALWLWLLAREMSSRFEMTLKGFSLGAMIIAVLGSIRQLTQGNLVSGASVGTGENYLYSAGLLALALAWLVRGIMRGVKLLRVAGLSLLTVVTLKVFLIDAAALTGLLRILSFLVLGIALIGIGWAYGRVIGVDKTAKAR